MQNRLGLKLDKKLREELQIAAAMARERIVETHVSQLLELIQITGDKLPIRKTIETYTQVNSLDQDTARQASITALARLGKEREAGGAGAPERADTEGAPEGGESDPRRSPLQFIRQRLSRGLPAELREEIELHTGRTQVNLLPVHLENALRFVQILTPDQSAATAVELYHEMLNVRRPVAEIVYFMVLDQLSRKHHDGGEGRSEPDSQTGATRSGSEHTLRIVNG